MAHHDAGSTGRRRRLVYGGHTIGLAAAQATRALPDARDDRRAGTAATTSRRCSRATRCARGSSSSAASRWPAAAGCCTCARASTAARAGRRRGREVLDWRFVGGAAVSTAQSLDRPARGRGLGLRRRAARRHDARPARRRRDPLRPDRRRPRLATAGRWRRTARACSGPGSTRASARSRSTCARPRAASSRRAGHRAGPGGRPLPDQLPRPRLARLRRAARAPRRPDHGAR